MVITKSIIFWDVSLCSLQQFTDVSEEHTASIVRVKVKAKQATNKNESLTFLLAWFTLTLKMEAVCFNKMSVNIYQITWCHRQLTTWGGTYRRTVFYFLHNYKSQKQISTLRKIQYPHKSLYSNAAN